MWRIITNFNRLEKILVFLMTGVVLISSLHLTWLFYEDTTSVKPAQGGIYAEGLVGQIHLLNPVFSNQNPIDADIVKLVFAGLMKYDAHKKTIVDDLATHTLSHDQKTYTFTILENAYFHDGEKVTADDVVYTYNEVIKNPVFKNSSLKRDFTEVEIAKVDAKTVTFTLPKPYKFFLTNLTIGILPKHLLYDLPVENLDQSNFNREPIGAGPFKFNQILFNTNSVDLSLKRYEKYHGNPPLIDGLILKVYPNYSTLLKNLDVLNGVRSIPKDKVASFPTQNRFKLTDYHLPQYVALFLNSQSDILKDKKVRLALQLATDREKIVKQLDEDMIIDDPLMEIDEQNWIYQYDTEKAAGGLFDAGWHLPEKVKQKDALTQTGTTAFVPHQPKTKFNFAHFIGIPTVVAESIKYITEPNNGNDFETSQNSFYLVGVTPADTQEIWVNNYQLRKFDSSKGTWSYKASTDIGTLREGENMYLIYAVDSLGNKTKIDELKITYSKDTTQEPDSIPDDSDSEDESVVAEQVDSNPQVADAKETTEVVTEDLPETSAENDDTTSNVGDLPLSESGTTLNTSDEDGLVEEIETELPKPKPLKSKNPIRTNEEGEKLTLRILTSERPAYFKEIAEEVSAQWLAVGIESQIEVLPLEDFQQRMRQRDYDILIYGQNLGYNLDTYPYWHSSQVGEKGVNIANYMSFESDSLMEEIRMTHDIERRKQALQDLKESMSEDVPAIFLYRPVYYLASDQKLNNMTINDLPTISDRYANVEDWYLKEDRFFDEGRGWGSIWSWISDNAWKFNK